MTPIESGKVRFIAKQLFNERAAPFADRLEHLENKADALLHCVIILGVAQLLTLIVIGVFAARLGL